MVLLNRKQKLFQQCKNGIITFDHYNSFNNNFNFKTTLCHARKNYFHRKFTEGSNNSRDTWKTVNSLIILCKNTSKDVILNHNGSTVSDPSVNVEVFINYFPNEASNFDRNIPHSKISPLNFLGVPVENSFLCSPSDREEIVNLIRWQKNNKSTDLKNIPVFIYKMLAHPISPTASMLFNNSLLEGIFPECFKTTKIIPIFKFGESNSTGN